MVLFTCEICPPNPNSARTWTKYSAWLSHLHSLEHQFNCEKSVKISPVHHYSDNGPFWTPERHHFVIILVKSPPAPGPDPDKPTEDHVSGSGTGTPPPEILVITQEVVTTIFDYCNSHGLLILNFIVGNRNLGVGGIPRRFAIIEFDDVVSKSFIEKAHFDYLAYGSYKLVLATGIEVLLYPRWISQFKNPHTWIELSQAPVHQLVHILSPIGPNMDRLGPPTVQETNNNSILTSNPLRPHDQVLIRPVFPSLVEQGMIGPIAPRRKSPKNLIHIPIQVGSVIMGPGSHMNLVSAPPVANVHRNPKHVFVNPISHPPVLQIPQEFFAKPVLQPVENSSSTVQFPEPMNSKSQDSNVAAPKMTKNIENSVPQSESNARVPESSSTLDSKNDPISTVSAPISPALMPIFQTNPFLLPTPSPQGLISTSGSGTNPVSTSRACFEDYFTLFDYFLSTNTNREITVPTRQRGESKNKKTISVQKELRAKSLQTLFLQLSPNQQLERFCSALTINEEEIRDRCEVLELIIKYLRPQFPHINLLPFGSFLTKLGSSDSDLDVLVDAYGTLRTKPGTSTETINKVGAVLKKIKVPFTYRNAFQITPVLGARIPILKMYHPDKNLNLDLSFENILSFQNSKLIAYYMDTYPIARPLTVFLRYWAKWHSFIGSFQIKNYALVLLILTFLAERKEIPSIYELQNGACPVLVSGWNSGFLPKTTIQNQLEPCTWTRLLELLCSFFKTYSTMDFETVVICSLLGTYVPRHLFTPGNESSLPQGLERYRAHPSLRKLKLNTAIVIQDPFELTYNVSNLTSAGTLFLFKSACEQTLGLLEKHNSDMSVPTIFDLLKSLPKAITNKRNYKNQAIARRLLVLIDEIGQNFAQKSESEPSSATQKASSDELQSKIRHAISNLSYSVIPDSSLLSRVKSGRLNIQDNSALAQIGSENVGRRKSFIKVALGKRFVDIFENNVGLGKGAEMRILWVEFVLDFLNEFWERGLCISNPGLEREETRKSITKNKEMDISKEAGESTLKSGSKTLDPQVEAKLIQLRGKYAVQPMDQFIYFIYTGQKSPNFWNNRKTKADEYIRKQAHLSGYESKSERNKSGKLAYISKNPIEIEEEITQLIMAKYSKKAYAFQFTLCGKLDNSSKTPELNLVFTNSRNTNLCNQEGFYTMVKVMERCIPLYLIFRLKEFLGITGESLGSTNSEEEFLETTNENDDYDDEDLVEDENNGDRI